MIKWYKKKSFLSKIKHGYFKKFNLPKFWSNLKIDKIDNELKKIVDNYLSSESLKFSSKYWNKINISNLGQINDLGIEKFHTTLSSTYFTFKTIDDDFINGLCDFFKENEIDPLDTKVLMKQHESFTITQSINYNLISFLLYQYLKKNGHFDVLKILETNNFMIEHAPILNIDSLKLTQDKLHSLIEYNEIKKIISDQNLNLNYLEVGAGSGRTTETIIRLDKRVNKYVIADLPPALYVNYLRIKTTFKNLNVKMCENVNSKDDLQKLIKENDILFIFPHQIKYFNDSFFDIALAIDCLHEMEKKVINEYMDLFHLKSKYLYYKVWEESYVPYCFNNYLNASSKKDYFIKPDWKQVFNKRCICPSNYIELAYKIKI
jgi:putative sugar O-methyltransferase